MQKVLGDDYAEERVRLRRRRVDCRLHALGPHFVVRGTAAVIARRIVAKGKYTTISTGLWPTLLHGWRSPQVFVFYPPPPPLEAPHQKNVLFLQDPHARLHPKYRGLCLVCVCW